MYIVHWNYSQAGCEVIQLHGHALIVNIIPSNTMEINYYVKITHAHFASLTNAFMPISQACC